MRGVEPITDPNVAAFFAYHAGFRMIVVEPLPPLSRWGRLFTWSPWAPAVPPRAVRLGRTLYMSAPFRDEVDFYVNSYRLEALERAKALREGSAAGV